RCSVVEEQGKRGLGGSLLLHEVHAVLENGAESSQQWTLRGVAARRCSGEQFPCGAWSRGGESGRRRPPPPRDAPAALGGRRGALRRWVYGGAAAVPERKVLRRRGALRRGVGWVR